MHRARTIAVAAQRVTAAVATCALVLGAGWAAIAGLALPPVAAGVTTAPATPGAYSGTDTDTLATPVTRANIAGTVVTLSAAKPAIPLSSGTIDYTVGVTPSDSAQSMRIQFSVYNPSGVLIHQRTRFVNDIQRQAEAAAEARASDATDSLPASAPLINERFDRELSDLSASAGVCTVRVDVVISSAASRDEGQLSDLLTVFDSSASAAQLAPVLRVSAAPLRDPAGTFTTDPASAEQTRLRANLQAVLRWLADTPSAHLTLAISPLLVDEWRDAADGYEVPAAATSSGASQLNGNPATGASTLALPDEGARGDDPGELPPDEPATTPVDATSPAAQSCAATIAEIERAVQSGRLTVTAQGYADPSITELSTTERTGDIAAQYERGATALNGLLTPMVTAPIATTLSRTAVSQLAATGVEVVILPDTAIAVEGNSPVSVGIVETQPSRLVALVGSSAVTRLLTADSDTSHLLAHAYGLLRPQSVSATIIDLSAQPEGAARLLSTLGALAGQEWVTLVGPRTASASAAGTNTPQLLLAPLVPPTGPPASAEHREAVATGRDASTAYIAIAPQSGAAAAAYQSGLVAQNGTPAAATQSSSALNQQSPTAVAQQPSGSPSAADAARLEHATFAANTAQAVFDAISIDAQSVTLPSAEGPIPITINNGTSEILTLDLTLQPSEGLSVVGQDPTRLLELPPQETFLNPTIRLNNIPAGELTIQLAAGEYTIAEKTIDVSASYIETVATIAVVAIVGVALVAYIWRRSNRAPADTSISGDRGDQE